jgi:CubicO group peptidase (beta-lactamase class C family)
MAVRTAMDDVLEQAVVSGSVPGVVATAADETGVIYEGAFGSRENGADVPMTLDTVFWIASMTKAITSVAAIQQVERGNLSLDGPIADVLPELADPKVLEGWDSAGAPILRPSRRPITLRHLLTHTAGFAYHIWNADILRYLETQGVPGIVTCQNAALNLPLVFDPGDRWEYGINIDWAGKAVEKVSGRLLDEYIRVNIADPLGMSDTTFVPTSEQHERRAKMHVRNADGSLAMIPFEMPSEPEFFMGGGGLFSTGRDYLRFLRAILNGGSLDGNQILKPETVAQMNRNQMGDTQVTCLKTVDPISSNDAEFFPGMSKQWGLAYMISNEAAPTGRSAGSLAWAGLANTYYWLDPTRNVAGVILTQILPFADPAVVGTLGRFERAIYGL